jgi:hypothetical protein
MAFWAGAAVLLALVLAGLLLALRELARRRSRGNFPCPECGRFFDAARENACPYCGRKSPEENPRSRRPSG